ncbi:MAG: ABC transporter ATP-binding protein/permease [Alphaproteobacteria bacterium]|nr:ABC transporter ATP-binding protein/permease [Alphaproteobacteria bacterium]
MRILNSPSMAPHGSSTSIDIDAIESRDAGLGVSLWRIGEILARPELRRWRPMMVVSLALTIVAKLFAVAAPVFFGDAVNRLGAGEAAIAAVVTALLLWSLARFMAACLPYVRDAIFAPISQAAQRVVAVDAYGKAQSLSLQFHQTRRTGALNRVIDRGAGALDTLIRFLAFNIGPTLIELALASVVLATIYGGWSALAAVATVALYGVFTYFITNLRVAQQRKLNEADTELRARAVDSLNNFETVKAFAAEQRETDRYDSAVAAYSKRAVDTSRSLAMLNAGQELIMNLGLTAVAALSAWASLSGTGNVRPGDLAAVTLIMMNLYRPLNMLGWAFREIKQGAVDLEKLYGLMGMTPEVSDAPGARAFEVRGGEVRFEDVSFAHDARAAGLEHVSFTAKAGAKVAIVGPSGSGKSTLLKLLFRFYDVQGGRVWVDGQDVRGVTQTSLREAIGLVPQDVVLFNTTLKENLIYGRPGATDEEVREAARKARLLEFIDALPQGWETRVGERGVKLSGGEKQRVGIARAILKDPAILVLDEATSALDSGTEAEVQMALDEASRGRTTLMVAHRLSTVAAADEIIVLDQGRVVERGTHPQLLLRGGLYADLWSRQARTGDAMLAEVESALA